MEAYKSFCSLGVLALAQAFATQGMAQEVASPASTAGVGEIVVTAQKRSQNVQDVGMAVSALDETAANAVSTAGIASLASYLPSLQVSNYSPTITIFNVRGVSQNDFADSQESPIAFYVDGVYISAMGGISGQMYDLERVEVLRGPQGTLFGRNATGGLIQAITAKPTDYLDGYVQATIGSYGQFSAEAAIGGPLSDHLRARVSLIANRGGAYIRNATGPDLGGQRNYGARVQLAGDVGANGKFQLKYQYLRNDHERNGGLYSHAAAVPDSDGLGTFVGANENPYGTCNGCDVFGYRQSGGPFSVAFDGPNYFNRTYHDVTLNYEHELGAVTLTSITDYQHLRKSYGEDADMSPAPIFKYPTAQKLDQFSQELRLAGNSDRLHWVVGGYAIWIDSLNDYDTDLSALGMREIYGGKLKTSSLAAFGQLEFKATDLFTLIGGLRYSKDVKKYDFHHAENGVVDLIFNKSTVGDLARNSAGQWSWKAQLNVTPNENMLLYAGVNRGTKSGGFGTPAFFTSDLDSIPFKPEVLTNYEAGLKLTFLDGRAHFNTSAFYYDYKNYQAFQLVNLALAVSNKQARVKGIEFQADVRPADGLSLSGFATVLDTRIKDVALPGGRIADTKMPQAPEFSAGFSIDYTVQVGGGNLKLGTNWKYDSSQYFSTFNALVDREPSHFIGNARISYELGSLPLEIAVFANNVTDKEYRVYNLDLSGPFGFTQQTFAKPRTFGASLTYKIGDHR
ncbi:putative TonB-dependent receptor [Caenibius tardaugens NBRC 16725]|uniref:Putative TonB-dependent receptor n=1 Tax=Caenibius tardaugens NBRC 16725 TaxID=1219035 RepID=U2Y3H2_9SPHN|nr:TonB-dependent receptor [Caenibius tardaugens]AZI37218.1 TonB-dependent receptor [Caenibius tardaugens NBRC 16725]GAD47536.1 putative TonB-dependent receptor [Caenibius tardaugens NBRC 16725]